MYPTAKVILTPENNLEDRGVHQQPLDSFSFHNDFNGKGQSVVELIAKDE